MEILITFGLAFFAAATFVTVVTTLVRWFGLDR